MIEELVVLSGKGGTGKTSVTASFAVLAGDAVVADCDVDAADLHLVLSPNILRKEEFRAGHLAVIRQEDCNRCGICLELCRFNAIRRHASVEAGESFMVEEAFCEGCGVCVRFCPTRAIEFPARRSGDWMISETRAGMMVHAHLDVPGENSGKLVSAVRREARTLAEDRGISRILADGPPGIGCPVIAAVTGATRMLAVTEPTPSGEHDLLRVLDLARHFGIPAAVCVNRWDINPDMTERIEALASELGADPVGRIRYDAGITRAQMEGLAVVETKTPAGDDIRRVWECFSKQKAPV